jgi:preprotein translocase subunit SecA
MPDVGTEIAEIEKSDLAGEEKIARKDELMRDFSIKSERIHSVNQLLKAYTLFEKDTEYILDEGKVKLLMSKPAVYWMAAVILMVCTRLLRLKKM